MHTVCCAVLCCAVLYCAVLYCAVLLCTIAHTNVPFFLVVEAVITDTDGIGDGGWGFTSQEADICFAR